MSSSQILTAIGFIGLGTIIPNFITYLTQLRKSKLDAKHILKEKRYKAIILLCFAFINYDKEKIYLIINRPDIGSIYQLQNELHAEWTNMALYASDKVITKMKSFLEQTNKSSFNDLLLAMRKDLYGIKTKLKSTDFEIKIESIQ